MKNLSGYYLHWQMNNNDPSFEFTKGELEGFYEVRDELLKHPETGYTVEEAHRLIRNKI